MGEKNLFYLMKIATESSQKLSDNDLETIVGIWTRKLLYRILCISFIATLKLL